MKTLNQFKKEVLKREGAKKAYAQLQPELLIIRKLALSRAEKGISQRELAKKIGITQSALARFETGNINPTLSFLQKITSGLGLKLLVK
jgi:ribosome-binding protein aMBF1 (putative translation factor)